MPKQATGSTRHRLRPEPSSNQVFDYVIVGAGSAGCVLANRLTEDRSVSVLLLESGPADSNEAIRVPALFSTLFGTDVDWAYEIEQQSHFRGSTFYPRGRTLGGSSSINLMVYIRGARSDFDGWSARGCTGWDYDSVLSYFVKAEHNSRLTGPLHGTGGPLYVEDRLFTHELSHAWIDSAADWGLPHNDDFNGVSQLGSGAYQVTCHNGVRWSTADAYLRPALDRANLTVRTGAQATRVLFDGTQATGVTYVQDGIEVTARAQAEVLLSGGVINSPQLLMLSGVGPAGQLRGLGIDVVADVPGVGENLHDHTMTPLVWKTQNSTDLLQMVSDENMALWASGRGGPFASNGGEVGGFFATQGGDVPDIQLIGGATGFVHHGRVKMPIPSFTMQAGTTHPASRGRLWLRSADPFGYPHIDPAYFTDPSDLDTVTAGLRIVLEIAGHSPIAKYLDGLNLPSGDTALDDAALRDHAVRWSQTEYHPVGTCAMGVDDKAVVDPQLRVRGVAGLRVVDASIMPTLISGNTNAAVIMIGEKAAGLLGK